MPWVIWQFASGRTFFAGAALLLLAVLLRPIFRIWTLRFCATLVTVISAGLIAASGTPLPDVLYALWSAAMVFWLIVGEQKSRRRLAVSARCALLLLTVIAVALEVPHAMRPSISGGPFPRLYVIGDSISAGLGSKSVETWPNILRSSHHIEVIDLARAGARIRDARRGLDHVKIDGGIVLLEIGGNDLIGSKIAKQFETDLDSLCASLEASDRKLVMLELPLFPFGNAFGRAQRRVAEKYHITLVPKRFLAGVLSAPGATTDGIHLSSDGQRRMARMVWDLLGSAFAPG